MRTHHARRLGLPLALCLALLPGCLTGERPVSVDRGRKGPPRSKSALFGDPALVPTRQGELARTELALAAEIDAQLRPLRPIADLRVGVQLPFGPRTEPAVTVTVLVAGEIESHDALEGLVVDTVTHIVPATGPEAVEVLFSPAPPDPQPSAPVGVGLVFALLGLGISLGITTERWWRKRRIRRTS